MKKRSCLTCEKLVYFHFLCLAENWAKRKKEKKKRVTLHQAFTHYTLMSSNILKRWCCNLDASAQFYDFCTQLKLNALMQHSDVSNWRLNAQFLRIIIIINDYHYNQTGKMLSTHITSLFSCIIIVEIALTKTSATHAENLYNAIKSIMKAMKTQVK